MAKNSGNESESPHLAVGRQGEDLAAEYLKNRGYKVIARNFRTRFGEIDLICRHRRVLVFVEVKTRSSTYFGPPGAAVDRRKQQKLSRTALAFLQEKRWADQSARFDVLEVTFDRGRPLINHLEDAFDLV